MTSNLPKSSKRNNVDFISNMPGPILQLILQGLPNTEEVVRTSVLSKQWRYLWTCIPLFPSLNIDCDRVLNPSMTHPQAEKLKDFVSWALANKTVDLDSFRLSCRGYHNISTVWQWIDAAVMRKVKKLDLMFCHRDRGVFRFSVLPHSLVMCESLESLRLYSYKSHVSFPDCKGFSALKVLELNRVTYYRANLVEKCLKMCLLLEKLSLIDCIIHIDIHTNDNLCIPCPKLKTLIIHDSRTFAYSSFDVAVACPQLVFFKCVGLRLDPVPILETCLLLEELHLINCIKFRGILEISCPKLKTLIIHDRRGHMNAIGLVVSCPELVFFDCDELPIRDPFILKKVQCLKTAVIVPQRYFDKPSFCKILARISHVESLSLDCSSICDAFDPEGNFPDSLPNLKTLELTTTFEAYHMKLFIRIVTCSPNLESIHLIIQKTPILNPGEYVASRVSSTSFSSSVCSESDGVQTMRILSPYVKRVEFVGFMTDTWNLEIAQLLLEHGNALEKMIFSWCNEGNYHEKSMEALNAVSKFHKASPSVELVTLMASKK